MATILVVLLSGLGLLCMRLGVYDDSLLLLGARLVGAGKVPYRDFYSHYGPLGYALMSPVLKGIGNPGLALRVAQAVGLAAIMAFLAFALRRSGARPAVLAAAALAFSAAFALSSFLGTLLAGAALALYVAGRSRGGGAPSPLALGAAGALLAATAWTRPAFAVYACAAMAALELACGTRSSRRQIALVLACALVASCGLWLWLFRPLGIWTVVEATLLVPARLMTLGKRTLLPDFASSPFPLSWIIGGAIAAAPIVWAWSIPSRRTRFVCGAAIGLGAVLPTLLGPRTAWLSVALEVLSFGTAAFLAFLLREDLRDSPALRAAAAFGISAAAFGHYFWSRPDAQHLYPLAAFSAASVAFAWSRLGRLGAAAALGILAVLFLGTRPGELGLPVENLWRGGIARMQENAARPGVGWKTLWPAGEVPGHAVAAVSLADRLAGSDSRFVAFGSDQSWTPGDPVFLFLLSSRLPYTKWFQYDPGLQSSPAIQEEMIREIEASGSRAAVVWQSENYFYDPKPAGSPPGRSLFDAYVDRVYGTVVGRFGSYEVRTRE